MIVSVIYQLQTGQNFDLDYYMKTHIPMVQKLFGPIGLNGVQVLHGVGSPNGPAPAKVIALLDFESADAFKKAIDTHGATVLGDIANFTQCTPSLQFNEVLT
jgi:uncharacterized protein (TIGR02118 family)